MMKTGDTTHKPAQKQGSQSAQSPPGKPRPKTGLRFPLWLQLVSFVALVTLLTGGVVGYVITNTSRETLQQEILNKNLVQAELAAQNASNYIKAVQAHVQVVALRPDVRQAVLNNTPDQVQAALAQFVQVQSALIAAGIYDEKGIQRVFSTAGATTIGQSFIDRDYIQQVMSTGQPFLGAPVISRATGKATAAYAVPIFDDQNKLRGILTGGISLSALSDAMVKIGYNAGTHASIIDTRNNLVVAAMLPELLVTQLQGKDEAVRGLLTGESDAIETVGSTGEKELVGFANVSGLPWGVIVATPSSIAMTAMDTLTRKAILYTGIAILCFAVLGVVLMLGVTRPITRLRNVMHEVAAGDFSRRANLSRNDEIGDLGVDFDIMAGSLSEKETKLLATLVSRDELVKEFAERKKAEKALVLSRQFLNNIIEQSPMSIWISDSEGTMIQMNQTYHELFGITDKEAVGKYNILKDTLIEEQGFMPLVKNVFEKGEIARFTIDYYLPRVEHIKVKEATHKILNVVVSPIKDINNKLINVMVQHNDVTASKQAEVAIRESEEKYAKTFQTSPYAITITSIEDGKFIEINDAFTSISGFTREEATADSSVGLKLWVDIEDRKQVLSALLKGSEVKGREFQFRRKNGEIISGLFSAKIIYLKAKPYILSSINDITASKQAEVALQKYREHLEELVKERTKKLEDAQEKLLASERLATLGQFSGNISHELRNPLGVIDSSVYYLKTKLKDADEKVHEHLDRIKLSVSNSTAIIESILNLTRMKSPELTKLDLTAVTSDAVATSKLPNTVISKLDFPEGEVPVNGDHEQLRMAFKNIIKNANEAMGAGGALTVTIRTAADGWAEVSFTDTGPGIAAEDMRKVFQPLFSRKAKGIGLGLAITRMIIEKHGGTIEAKSEHGKGATFVIRLPLHADKDKEA